MVPLERRSYGWENTAARRKGLGSGRKVSKNCKNLLVAVVAVKVAVKVVKAVKVAVLKFRRL